LKWSGLLKNKWSGLLKVEVEWVFKSVAVFLGGAVFLKVVKRSGLNGAVNGKWYCR